MVRPLEEKETERKAKFDVKEWIVNEKESIEKPIFTATIKKETEKAYQIERDQKIEWIPKSQINKIEFIKKPRKERKKERKEEQEGFMISKHDLAVKWALEASSRNLMGITGYSEEEIEKNFKKWFSILLKYLGVKKGKEPEERGKE